jgi:hypothetical protein
MGNDWFRRFIGKSKESFVGQPPVLLLVLSRTELPIGEFLQQAEGIPAVQASHLYAK